MKRKLLFTSAIIASSLIALYLLNFNSEGDKAIDDLRKQHLTHLENSPYKETQYLTRTERKELRLTPNAYNEQMWELTMNPSTGRPTPEVTIELQRELMATRAIERGVGGESTNPWVSRGPNNQGGRTRGIMFDPNDVGNANPDDDYTRVFAGGVSGGLWVNEDITDANVSWTLVPTIQQNISVTAIISDPNNSNIFYIASGESYTQGSVVGRGVWKSTDAGQTWNIVLGGGVTSVTNGGENVNGLFYVNDIVARDNAGVTEIYAAVASGFYADAGNPNNFQGVEERGLYKSTDDGNNWSRFPIQYSNNTYKNPNDIEIDINNNIYFTTTSDIFGNVGGEIFKSTDGITFNSINSVFGAQRTEIEPSPTDANKFWIVAELSGAANIYITTDGFSTITAINEPNDVDNGVPATDYTRNQAFYNLPVEVDQNNNLYVGGIDLFRSPNDGSTWEQLSKWSNNNNLSGLNVPFMHADQHAIVFRPGTNDTEAVFGNDGGVYYTANITAAVGNPNAIQARNKDFVTTQFYYGAINPIDVANGDDLAGGTQDNGTQFLINGVAGLNPFTDPVGGDGGFTEIDEDGYAITSYPGNNHIYIQHPSLNNGFLISSGSGGSFINEATLDKNLDILYTNATVGNNRRIERIKDFVPGGAPTDSELLTSPQFNASPSALKVSPFNTSSSTLYVGLRNGKLLRGGFADFTAPAFVNISGSGFIGSISDIEFGQSEQEIFVTMHNYGVVSIWFSADGGNTWSNIEGNLPDLPVKCILQNPLIPEELIIGTELGVWATPDYTAANPVWVQAYNGMSDVTVVDLDLRTSDNTILASTHGKGLFTSQFTNQPLSVLENEFNTKLITLFPTISNGQITIKSERNLGNAVIKVFNINAQEVYSTNSNISTSNTNVNLDLNAGMYFVNITVDNYTETKKIIIK
ncbi:T9SS type A sorting domain-containing protein [Psychroserpens damuponensis]|uniref:T9SS type A sorting domain-containing protein n=1 Tax=Psychroserpens damuponensis TaxID=943936 RepID=UPI00058DB149|nr:T9SS type A sorting domain-containing protein [Psychroserpens damuponensis]